jgi:hypothetical protein
MTCLLILNFDKVHWSELLLFPIPLKFNCLQLKIMPFQNQGGGGNRSKEHPTFLKSGSLG